jgi:hypothetical protein
MTVCIGFQWLNTGTRGELLCEHGHIALGFRETRVIYLASLSTCTKLVSLLQDKYQTAILN